MAGGSAFGAAGLASGSINSIGADASLPGAADMVSAGAVLYSASANFLGDASFTAAVILIKQIDSAISGDSSVSAMPDSDAQAIALMVGAAAWFLDPTKITVVSVPQQSQIPTTAKPPTIPTIRPPVPPVNVPQLSVSPPGTGPRGKGQGQSRRGL